MQILDRAAIVKWRPPTKRCARPPERRRFASLVLLSGVAQLLGAGQHITLVADELGRSAAARSSRARHRTAKAVLGSTSRLKRSG